MKKILFLVFLLSSMYVNASFTLHNIFSDNMVLQRNVEIPIFGYADANEQIKVTFNGETKKATLVNGKWKVFFPKMKAGGPYRILVTGSKTIELKNVMIGDVWLCGGQSNMAFRLSKSKSYNDLKKLDNDNIRVYRVEQTIASQPKEKLPKEKYFWKASSKESIKSFSAVGYYFADVLEKELSIPIALIGSYWGGTPVERWMPENTLRNNEKLKTVIDDYEKFKETYPARKSKLDKDFNDWKLKNKDNRKAIMPWKFKKYHMREGSGLDDDFARPSALYNAMINPLTEFPIKGVIWYQGESNAKTNEMADLYEDLFSNLIMSWRDRWQTVFPFYYVQLASYKKAKKQPKDAVWARLRESQTKTLKLKNTGMAVTLDVGEENNIHPTNKKIVGHRLALQALQKTYGKKIISDGPSFKEMNIENDKVILTFQNVGSGLIAKDVLLDTHQLSNKKLQGFAICAEDKKFVWADAEIKGNKVILSHPEVTNPVAARYGWADFPLCNLYNKEGLPAVPFRTDSNR